MRALIHKLEVKPQGPSSSRSSTFPFGFGETSAHARVSFKEIWLMLLMQVSKKVQQMQGFLQFGPQSRCASFSRHHVIIRTGSRWFACAMYQSRVHAYEPSADQDMFTSITQELLAITGQAAGLLIARRVLLVPKQDAPEAALAAGG